MKVHYPVPVYLQPALSHLGHKVGDFPVTDRHARSMISFPAHDHLEQEELEYMVDTIGQFYAQS